MRARINERLERATRYTVTLITAPAGFGKSIALRDFLQSARLDAVRYDVSRDDNTLLVFVQRLSEALEAVAPTAIAAFPSIQEHVLGAVEPVKQLSDWFAEHLKRTVCTIVIDDLHYAATDPASIALLADLVERSGDRIRWIIAARSDAGLPVGSWLAYGRMDLPIGEEDLRFTTEEALAAADANSIDADAQEVESLRQLTDGWPVALTIALRTRIHSHDLRSASLGTREMIYRYLAEQVFSRLSESEHEFALATCVFPEFDLLVAEHFGATASWLQTFRARVAFLNEPAPAQYRYHDLFRDFLEAQLRRRGEREWAMTMCNAAHVLELRGELAEALGLYTKAKSVDDIIRIVNTHGFSLFERGESERLSAALDCTLDIQLYSNPACLGLKAVIESARGHFNLVERRFLDAIELAHDEYLRIALVQRYAIELVRHDKDCVGFLQPFASDINLDRAQRVPLLGTLATAFALSGNISDATDTIQRAISLVDATVPEDIQARLFQQAAYVYHLGPSVEKTRSFAEAAIALALRHDLYDVAARAYTVLFTLVYNEDDDPIASLAVLDKVDENALKGVSQQAHIFALIAAYEIEAERGSESALERLDESLRDHDGVLPRARFESLAPAIALREAWRGDFSHAAAILHETLDATSFGERRALRAAETALYASAAGDALTVAEAISAANESLAQVRPDSRRAIKSRCFLALAEVLRGHEASAQRYLFEAEKALTPPRRRLRALVNAIRIFHRARIGQADQASLTATLERLNSEHLGGIARLLATLPNQAEHGHALGALTAAEREILQMLAAGASTKDVANTTGRSPHTVDTHIRSICRKLNCSGRREAVALATSRGWVQT